MKREVYDYMAGKADVYKGVKETGYEGFTKAMENGDYRKRVYDALKATGAWTYDYETFDKSWNAPEQPAAGAGETDVVNGGGVPHVSSESQEPKTEEEVANFFANVPKQKVDDYDSSYDPMRLSLEKYQAKEDFIKSLEEEGVNSESVYAAIDAGEKEIEKGRQEALQRRNEERREDSRVPVGPNFARVEGMYEDTPAARDLSNFSLAKDLYDDARNLLDASFKGSGFGRGVWDAVYDVDAWTAGLTELGKNVQLNRVYKKAKEGEELTASEARLLDAANYYTLAGALQQAYLPSTWYRVGQGFGGSIPHMLQFALTYGPASSAVKGLASAVFKKLGRNVSNKIAKSGVKVLAEGTEAAATGAVQTPMFATNITSDTYRRMMGNAEVAVDENGVPVFMGMTDQKSLGQAFGEAVGAQYITNLSEVSGRMLSGAGHLIKRSAPRFVQKGLEKMADNRYVRAMADNAFTRGVRKVGKPFQLGNTMEEVGEEYVEWILNGLLIGDTDLESLNSIQSFVEITGTVAVTQVFFGGLGAGMNHRSKRSLVKQYEKAEREYDALFSSPEERDMYVSYVNLNLNGVQGKGGKPMLTVLREAVEKMVNSKGDNFVRADGTFDTEAAKAYREEVSRVFGNYFVSKQLYDSYMAGIRTRKEADRERIATEMQEKAVNGQIMTVTLADGRRARVVSGDIVVDGDGRIDVGRSGDHFTAVYEDDGSTVQLPVEDSYTVEVVSVEDAVEAASRANDEMINREEEEAVYGPRPKLGETVTMLDSEGNRVQLVVSGEVDESGNFMAVPMEDFDNNVKGMAVAVNMSQIVRDDAASEGVDGANEAAGASLQESGEGVAGEAETESTLSQKGNGESGELASEGDAMAEAIGRNRFGTIYQWTRGKFKEAAAFLRKKQGGYIKGVFHRDDIGDIDMIWGNDKAGLKHIIQKHIVEHDDFDSVAEAMETINRVIENGTESKQGTNISFDHEGYRVSIAQSGEGNWVLTAFDMTRGLGEKKRFKGDATIGDQNTSYMENGTLVSPQLESSESEGSEFEGEKQGESALSRIEKDAKGQPLYEKADVETAWDALVEQSEGDESIARDVAASMVKDKEAALKKMEKAPAKGATPAEKIADAKKRKADIEKARAELEHWQRIAGVAGARVEGESEAVENTEKTGNSRIKQESEQQAYRETLERGDAGNAGYLLSDEVDENGRPFVLNSNGEIVFGEIGEDTGLTPAPILLSEGYQDENGKGYGLAHIEANHGEQIRNAGFSSVEEFVSFVAQNYDEDNIRVGKRRAGGSTTYLLQVTDTHDNTLFIEMSKDGTYWNVNSAGIFRKGYSNKKETVVKTEPQQPNNAISIGSSLSENVKEGITSSEPNGEPTVSDSKDSERSGENQGKSEENAVISTEEDIDVTVGRVMEIPDAGDRSALVSGLLASAKAEEKSVSRVKNKVDPRNTQSFLAEQQRIRGEQDKARAEVAYWEEVKRIVEESNATESAPAEISKVKAARPKSIRERISALGEVLNLRDYILRALATGEYKFIWGDNRNGTKGLGSHLGFGNNRRGIEERQRRIWLLNNEEGLYPEQVAERLYANIQAEYPYLAQDDVEVFNEMLDVLRYDSAKDMVSEAEDMRRRREEMYEEYESDQAMYDATMQERDERVDAENEAYRRELESQESGTPAEGRAAEPLGDTVVAAEAEVNTNPTEKQKEAEYSSIKTISGESRDAVTDNLMPNTEPTAIQGFDGYSQSEIKSIVQEYIQQKLDENDISANVVGIAIHGSRGRGNAKENSDLDVVVEYEGDIREDGMFNLLNDDDNGEALYIEGIRVDINPIRAQETGTLDKYMERSRKYDEEVLSNDSVEDSTVRYRRGEDGVQGVRRTQESEMEREVRGFGERMADRLGGGVRLVYSDEIADSEAHAEEKRRSKGYYDTATGEVVVVLDNNTVKGVPSVIEVAMTMMHEVVGHKGVRGLFGTKEDAFLDDVYRGMKARTKAEMESLYGGQLRRREGESEEAFEARRRRLMADEYIARVAEEGNNPGLLRRVGAKVRGLLRGLGVELAITDNEIRDILRRSARELTRRKDRAINVREDGDVRYRESVNERFNKELEQQIDGTLPKGHIYQLGLPGEILRSTGIPDLPIELSSARLAEKAAQRNHEFELSDVKGLPEALENPIAIFSYGNKDKAQNIIVEIEKAGKKFVVGLHLNQDRRGILVNDIRGIFPKDNAEWLNWISQGKLLYVDKNKIQDLIDKQRTNLAEVEYLDLDSITNIVENFENPKVGGENVRYRAVYHGSPADFERFDHSFMGTGEGAQAYGWGTYVTEVDGIARSYAEKLSGRNYVRKINRLANHVESRKDFIKTRKRDIKRNEDYEKYAKTIRRNLRDSQKEYKVAERAGNEKDMEFYQSLIRISEQQLLPEHHKHLIDSFWDDINNAQADIDRSNAELAELNKKLKELEGNRHLYNVEIPDDTGENYLNWNEKPTAGQLSMIADEAEKEGLSNLFYKSDNGDLIYNGSVKDGEWLYGELKRELGNDKAVSEFLSRAGFTGIKYPAEATTGGRADGAKNYVIFDERDLDIRDHIRFRLTEEEQGIVEEAKRDGSYMKAPNGEPTQLNEKQWAQVRTRAFKAWFGDWEKAARIGKLRGSRPVEISGEEYKGKYELNRDSAKQWMKDNLRGEYTNKDTGEKIEISKVGVNKVTSHGERDEAHLKSIVAIPQLIGNSIFIDEHINEKGNDKYDSYRYYVCGLKIDGEDYTAKIVIGVKGDSKYYDHRLTQIEKGTLINNLNAMANHVAEKQNADVSISKDTKLLSILQVNSLKDVDENGEPTIFEPTGEVDKSNGDEESGVLYRKVTDMDTLKRLEEEPTIKVYRAMANIDGKLYPPMSTKIDGKLRAPIELGVWEEAEERPDLVDEKGNFKLKKDNGTTVPARYNPYIHTSRTPLNDQFSSAYKRPNLVTVEVEVPVSELTSGYHAEKAKDSVGEKSWHAGPVSGKLPTGKKRKVILSRWDKPIRIVPDEEVAKKISEILDGENIPIPYNVITPSLRKELEKLGVLIKDVGRDDIRYRAAEADYASVQDDASGEYAEALSAPMDISVADMMPIEAAENAQAAGLLRDVVNRFPDTKIAITDLSRVYAAAEVAEEEATEVRYRRGVNERFNEELERQIAGELPKGHVYSLGRPSEVLLAAGIPDLPIELAASRLGLKASAEYESNHPFELGEVMNLPEAIQHPIAVFDSKTRVGSKVILVELKDRNGNNFVVAMNTNVPNSRYSKASIQINSIRSIYPKDNVRDIVGWINRGDLLRYADKKKIEDWITQQRSNSADVEIQNLDVAANIVKEFENPAVDGENVRYRRGISFDTRGASHRDTDITGRRERSFGEKASRLKEKAGISLYDEQLKLKQLQGKVAEWLTGSRKGALDDRLLFYEAENQAGSIAMDRKVRFDNEYRERLFALRAEVFKALGNKVDDKYYFYAKTLNERTGVIGEEAMAANKATMFSHLLSEQHPGHDFPEGFFDPKEYGYEALQEYARKEGWIDSIEGYIADCESRMGEKLVKDIWGVIGEIAEYQLTTSMKKGLITRDHFDRLMYGRPLAELVRENLEKGLITEGQYRAFLATDFTADELVKAGFITREQREGLKRRYEYYLPLKGDSEPTTEEVADYERSRSRVSWQIKSVKGGNTRLVNDPVSRLLADVYASISYQEKMAWIQSMYHALRLAERQGKGAGDFAILDNWVVKDETGDYVPYVRYVEGEPVFTPTEQEIAKGEVERARNLPIETAIRVPEAVQGEHIVKLKHRGRTIHIYFRDPAVANAVNNHFVPRNVPKLMKGLRAAGGFMGKVYTQWNIFFSVRNLSKDFGEAAINNYVQYGGRYMAEYMVNYWRVMRHAGTTLRGAKRSLVPRNDYERRVEEFFKYGGEVSYTQIESYDKAIRDFERELKRSADKRGVVSVTEAGFVKIGEAVSAANKLIELNARLATFITSRERGYGLRQSIRDAKEVTVNFDRRGRNSMEFGSLFLFWNAGRQSNRRKWELMRENPGRFWTSRAAMGLLNVAQTYVLGSALAAVFGVDWEDYMTGYYDIPDYIRYNNIVVMSADGKVYRIPLSPAFAPYKTLVENIGEATYRTAFNDRDGRYDWGKGMADIVKSVSADLGDLTTWEAEGGKRLIGWAPAPTVPLLEAICNVDFTGRPVYKVGNSATPGYKRAYAGTKDVYVEITEWLNRVSGGEEAYGSWVGRRANPGAVQHVVEGYLGGLIQVLSKFWNVPEALKGASYERLPFVDTFYYGDAEMLGEREVRDDIYDARRLVESYNDVRSNFRKTDEDYDGNPKTVRFLENNEYRIDELKDLLKMYDEVTEELKSEDSEAYRRELRLLRRSIVELTNEMEEY